ncbi:MAG: recombinase family protein [Cytophagales bacterium]|nr:recombinase family protein [Cytophagales bacterium]
MKVIKYNRTSSMGQEGARFDLDTQTYDEVLFDRGVSGKVPFKERPEAKRLVKWVEEGKVKELVVAEISRLGRNTGDCISVLEWLEEYEVNVVIQSNSLQSRPNGVKNPIWKVITSIFSSIYEMELENIKERTTAGRVAYVQNGGKLGKPKGSNESTRQFLTKDKNVEIARLLSKGRTYSEISSITGASPTTISKVKRLI